MSNSIDNRIVNMQFNNGQFENGIKASTKSLENLKKGLDLQGSAKGLSELNRAGNTFSLSGMANSIEGIASRFTTLGIIGVTALQNITNAALNAGTNIVKSLTLDPVMDGFSEYETKMGAIQTIMTNTANKGTTLKDVNAALGELNEYADQTIYNFATMTDNVGKFTAAGVDLDDSVTTVKGLANVAAGFGVDAERMARATYQMSQALQSGAVKLQDWNSMTEAGMGGEMLQDELRKTAKEMGVFVDAGTPFRETLKEGWLSSEVFVKTMDKMAKNKSLLEAATNVTTFTKLMGTMKEAVGSGWATTWEKIVGDKGQSTALFTGISTAFGEIVKASADARNSMLEFWNANGGRAALLEGIANILLALSNIIAPIEQAFREMFPAITGQRLVELSKAFKDFTSGLLIGKGTAENIRRTFAGLFAVVDIGKKILTGAAKIIGMVFSAIFPVTGGFLSASAGIGDFLVSVNELITTSNVITKVLNTVSRFINFLKKTLASVTVESDVFMGAMASIKQVLSNVGMAIQNAIGKIKSIFAGLSSDIMGATSEASDKVSTAFDGITSAGERLKASLMWLGDGFNETVLPALKKVGSVIQSIFGPSVEVVINKLKQLDFSGIGNVLAGGGIILLATSFKKAIDSIKGVTEGFNGIIEGITGTLEAFQTKLKADALFKIALAIGVLALAIVALSAINSSDLEKALGVLSVLFIELTASMWVLQKAAFGMVGTSLALISLGVAILLLSVALARIASIDPDKLTQGIEGLSAIMLMLAIFTKVTSGVQSGTLGLIGISVGILILATALKKFGDIDPKKLEQGITGIAASLMSLALFIRLAGDPKNMLSMGIGIIAISGALYLLAGAIAIFGNMEVETLAIGITALAASLMVIALAARAMTGSLAGAAAMVLMALAINMLVPAIVILGNLDLKTIGVALLALAGIFVVLGLSALILTPLVPIIIALAASVGLLGIGMFALGGGLMLFAAGLAALAGGGLLISKLLGIVKESIPMIVSIIKELFASLIILIRDLIPPLVSALLEFVIVLSRQLNAALPEIIQLGMDMFKSLLKGIASNIQEITTLGIDIILEFLRGIVSRIPDIITLAADIIVAFVDGLEKELPRIVDAAIRLVIMFTDALVDGIIKATPKILEIAKKLGLAMLNGLILGVTGIKSAMDNIGKNIVDGMVNGVKNEISRVVTAGKSMGSALLTATKNALGIKSPSKETEKLGGYAVAGMEKGLGGMAGVLAAFGNGIKNGINKTGEDTTKAAEKSSSNVAKASSKVVKKSAVANKKVVDEAGKSAKEAFDKAVEWIDERKYYNKLSLSEELAAWENLQKKYLAGSEERKKVDREVYRVRNELVKAGYDNSITWIDDRKYYNQLALKEELAAWERVQARYLAGSEERKKADKEVYRVKQELGKAELNNSLNWIADRKYYDELPLTEELAAFKRVQARYVIGSEERKQMDKEIYRLEKEIRNANEEYSKETLKIQTDANEKRIALEDEYYDKTKTINDKLKNDIQSVTDEYESAVKSRADALYNAYGLFDKVETPQDDVKVKIAGLKEELTAWERTQQQYKMGTEKRKQADEEVLRVRKELISAEKEKITGAGLLQNLEDQVKISELWKNNMKVLASRGVDDGLMQELQAMGPKSIDQIKALNTMSKPELERYVMLWQTKHSDAKDQAVSELEGMRLETITKISELNKSANTELDAYRTTWGTQMMTLTKDTTKALSELTTDWLKNIGELRTDTEKEFQTMGTNIQNEINKSDWSLLGYNIIEGIINGVKSNEMMLTDELTKVGINSLDTLKTVWDQNSPSKEFANIGGYAMKGLANGLVKYSGLAITATKTLGGNAIESLRDTFTNIANVLTILPDMTPTIRPVLDMSNVENGLASTFDKVPVIDVSGSTIKASTVATTGQQNNDMPTSTQIQTDNTKNSNIQITNNYTVRSNEDIRKISSELRNTLDRYNYAKGVAVI